MTIKNKKNNRRSRGSLLFILFSIILLILFCFAFFISPSLQAEITSNEEIYFTILHTNDEHSALIPHSPAVDFDIGAQTQDKDPTVGGFARLASAVQQIRDTKAQQKEPVLLFNAGDFMGGAAYSWLTLEGYSPELKLMQKIGYDAAVIGNHEYDYGPEVLASYLINAGYPEAHEQTALLAANTNFPHDSIFRLRDLYRKTHLIEIENGIKIGLMGLIGDEAVNLTMLENEIKFYDQIETAEKITSELEEKGADIIIALTHFGFQEDKELARRAPEIDVIVGGHCHKVLHEPVVIEGTIIVQAGSKLRYLGFLELAYNNNSGKLRIRNRENKNPFLIKLDSAYKPDERISEYIDEYTAILNNLIFNLTNGEYNHIFDTVVRSSFEITNQPYAGENPAGNFITDAMRIITEKISEQKVDVALQVRGNIRKNFQPGRKGDITFYEITEVVGLGRGLDKVPGFPVVTVYFTGEEIKKIIEVGKLLEQIYSDSLFFHLSGLKYEYNPSDVILFNIPFLDQPIPTMRAVKNLKIYSGDFLQTSKNKSEQNKIYKPLINEKLYNFAADSYTLSFIPLIADLIPAFDIVPKNKHGEVLDLSEIPGQTVEYQHRELKVWETVIKYAQLQPAGEDGLPHIDEYYKDISGRIIKTDSWSYLQKLTAGMVVSVGVIILWSRQKN